MKMGDGSKTRFTTQGYHLSLLHAITYIHQSTILLQVPVTRTGTIGMCYHDIITIAPVLPVPSSLITILFDPGHDTVPGCYDLSTPFHFKVDRSPALV